MPTDFYPKKRKIKTKQNKSKNDFEKRHVKGIKIKKTKNKKKKPTKVNKIFLKKKKKKIINVTVTAMKIFLKMQNKGHLSIEEIII